MSVEVSEENRSEWSPFKKSSFSANGQCVEVAFSVNAVRVRDSKSGNPDEFLGFTIPEWHAFVMGIRNGEFDPPVMP
jgi:hypothetical protein